MRSEAEVRKMLVLAQERSRPERAEIEAIKIILAWVLEIAPAPESIQRDLDAMPEVDHMLIVRRDE